MAAHSGGTDAGIVAVLLGAVLVFFFFPKGPREKELLVEYHDTGVAALAAATAASGATGAK